MEQHGTGQAPRGPGSRSPQLDKRLGAAYDMIPRCGVCADIGADHGRLSAVCLLSGKVRHMLVADISQKALTKAQRRLEALGLMDRATFAVADGLQALDALPGGRVEVLCALGMGGETIAGILRRGKDRLQGASLVLGPQTEMFLVREALNEIGYHIRRERVVEAVGHFYPLMEAAPRDQGEAPHTRREVWIGAGLEGEHGLERRAFWARRARLLQKAIEAMGSSATPKNHTRLALAEEELRYLEEVLSQPQGGQEFPPPIQK